MICNKWYEKVFFPYSHHSYPLLHNLLNEGVSIHAACYKGNGLVGKDIAYALNLEEEGLIVEDMLDISCSYIKHFIILDSGDQETPYIGVERLIEEVKKYGGKVTILSRYVKEKLSLNSKLDTSIRQEIHSIEKPIIFVAGLFDSKFNSISSLALQKALLDKGIQTAIYTGDANLEYLDCDIYNMPQLEKLQNLPYLEYCIHRDIMQILDKDIVDLLIVQLPGGLLQMNEQVLNDFGIYCTIFNDIASPDYIVCNLPIYQADKEIIERINQVLDYKYRRKVDTFMVCNYDVRLNEPMLLSVKNNALFLPHSLAVEKSLSLCKELSSIKSDYALIATDVVRKLGGE